MVLFESLGTVSYSLSIVTMVVSLTVYEIFSVKFSVIFSVKRMHDLENWVRGCSRSLKTAPFHRLHTTSYSSAILIIALSCTVFELFDVE